MYRHSCMWLLRYKVAATCSVKLKVSVLHQHSSPRIRQWHPACSKLWTVQGLYINDVQSVYNNAIVPHVTWLVKNFSNIILDMKQGPSAFSKDRHMKH
jgi:hypothetical protein